MSSKDKTNNTFRLQGTDGVRGRFLPSDDDEVAELTPQQSFCDRRIITGEFVEVYLLGHLLCLRDEGLFEEGDEVVLGWDPRDIEGELIGGALRGIVRGGGIPVCVGDLVEGRPVPGKTLPTPAVPLYMIYRNAPVSFMLTASHNPASQNGVKVFLGTLGLKTFPVDDIKFTEYIMGIDYDNLPSISEPLDLHIHYETAGELYKRTLLTLENSWITGGVEDAVVVIDHANGSLVDIAEDVVRDAGVGNVYQIGMNRKINEDCGVVGFEGWKVIPSGELEEAGAFEKYEALMTAYRIGNDRIDELKKDKLLIVAVFDGDGDRFYPIVLDPYNDRFIVIDGDRVAVLVAHYLAEKNKGALKNLRFINTIDSDISASSIAEKMGFDINIVPVGDKWLLWKVLERLTEGLDMEDIIDESEPPSTIEVTKRLTKSDVDIHSVESRPFLGIAYENSGHIITDMIFETMDENMRNLYTGDGLKSFLNAFTSLILLYRSSKNEDFYESLYQILPDSYKKNEYLFFTRQRDFSADSPLFAGVEEIVGRFTHKNGLNFERVEFPVEPHLLYYRILEEAKQIGVIFLRNSGTEVKTGVYTQSLLEYENIIKELIREILRYLYKHLKDWDSVEVEAQVEVLKALEEKGSLKVEELREVIEGSLIDNKSSLDEFLDILEKKEGLITLSERKFILTDKGRIFLKMGSE